MKKSLRLTTAAAVLSIVLSGCSGKNQPPEGDSQADSGQIMSAAPVQDEPENADPGASAGDPEGLPDSSPDGNSEEKQEKGEQEEEKEVDQSAFEWRIEPFLSADDINPLSAGLNGANYGDFSSTDYMLITRGGRIGIITRDGEVALEPEYTRAFSYMQEGGDLHILFTDGDPDAGDRVCFCVTTGTMIRTAEQVCTLCGGQLKDSTVGKAAVWDPEAEVFGKLPAAQVRRAKSGETVSLKDAFTSGSLSDASVARSITLPKGFSTENAEGSGKLNDGYGIVRNGREMTAFIYENATDFKDGVAAFCRDGKWGYLNVAGRMVLPFAYDGDLVYTYDKKNGTAVRVPYLPSEGYVALNQGERAGFANLGGVEVIPIGTFAAARPVCGGLAWVKDIKTGLWGVVAVGGAVTGETAAQPQQGQPDEQEQQAVVQLPPATGEGWQAAYAEVLRSDGNGETLQFSLCMVDGDEIPELVLHWYDRKGFVQENEDVEMYTYKDGRLIYLGNVACDGYCTCKYLPQKHLVLVGGMRDDVAIYDFKLLEGGELKTVASFNMVMNGKNVTYMVDGAECKKEEYVSRWKEYYNGDVSYDGGMYRNTDENVVGLFGVEPLEPAE